MQALRQKMRPKHQVLILKCYPRLSKNSAAAEIKPNASELSYLLYYASSRRSKLTKVGTFLEKRTVSDLNKSRTSSVQITLLILTAFLNNPAIGGAGPAGFGLFAPFALKILADVLQRPCETVLLEDALSTWAAFCAHQDHLALSADSDYRALFTKVVKLWTDYALRTASLHQTRRGSLRDTRVGSSASDAIRVRTAGLQALDALVRSDSLTFDNGGHLVSLLPVILQTLSGTAEHFQSLLDLQEFNEAQDRSKPSRPSMAPTRYTMDDTDVRAAEGTAAEADKLAEQEADLVALQCLRNVFAVENRLQIRAATALTLQYMTTTLHSAASPDTFTATHPAWSVMLFETICNWIPVQDRFVALFVAVETLVRGILSAKEINQQITRHLLLADLIAHVLAADINFIGLSVMDMMLGLLQCILRVLQTNNVDPIQANGAIDVPLSDKGITTDAGLGTTATAAKTDTQLLFVRLQETVKNLAVHVYYTDQISDMVSAVLLRLDAHIDSRTAPSPPVNVIGTDTTNAFDSLADAGETSTTAFSTDAARQVALIIVADIMTVANAEHSSSGYVAHNRNAVPVGVWEGTHWLLRDPALQVRQSYVHALCTWLRLEAQRTDNKQDEPAKTSRPRHQRSNTGVTLTDLNVPSDRSSYLHVLHLSIYENATHYLDHADADADLLLLHLLLGTMTSTLRMNAVRVSLPMIMALQEDGAAMSTAHGRVRVSNLVFGFLRDLCTTFSLHDSTVSQKVHAEIERRIALSTWHDALQVPPPASSSHAHAKVSSGDLGSTIDMDAATKTFKERHELVQLLAQAHRAGAVSSELNGQSSPERGSQSPLLSPLRNPTSISINGSPRPRSSSVAELPEFVMDDLLGAWSREAVHAALDQNARSASFTSFTGLTTTQYRSRPVSTVIKDYLNAPTDHRHLLATANSSMPKRRSRARSRDASPHAPSFRDPGSIPLSMANSMTARSVGGRVVSNRSRLSASASDDNVRRHSDLLGVPHRRSADSRASTSQAGTVRVNDLKRVLISGNSSSLEISDGTRYSRTYDDDTGSESMMDVDESFGEFGEENEMNEGEQELRLGHREDGIEQHDFAGTFADGSVRHGPRLGESQPSRADEHPNGVQVNGPAKIDMDAQHDAESLRDFATPPESRQDDYMGDDAGKLARASQASIGRQVDQASDLPRLAAPKSDAEATDSTSNSMTKGSSTTHGANVFHRVSNADSNPAVNSTEQTPASEFETSASSTQHVVPDVSPQLISSINDTSTDVQGQTSNSATHHYEDITGQTLSLVTPQVNDTNGQPQSLGHRIPAGNTSPTYTPGPRISTDPASKGTSTPPNQTQGSSRRSISQRRNVSSGSLFNAKRQTTRSSRQSLHHGAQLRVSSVAGTSVASSSAGNSSLDLANLLAGIHVDGGDKSRAGNTVAAGLDDMTPPY